MWVLERQFSPYEYLPFGGGSRSCIGMAYTQFEMRVVLASILSRFELALNDNYPVRAVRLCFNLIKLCLAVFALFTVIS